jgi:hypothetical protein
MSWSRAFDDPAARALMLVVETDGATIGAHSDDEGAQRRQTQNGAGAAQEREANQVASAASVCGIRSTENHHNQLKHFDGDHLDRRQWCTTSW